MTTGLLSFVLMQVASLLLDALARPRRAGRLRGRPGTTLHALAMTGVFGLFLGISGNPAVAGVLGVALMLLVVVGSNAKHAMLGEPLLFSDLALFAALVRHPGFYLTALSAGQKAGIVVGAGVLLLALGWLFVPRVEPHLAGVALVAGAVMALVAVLRGRMGAALARTPDAEGDVAQHGLVATLLLYWLRWRATPDPPACPAWVPGTASGDEPPEFVVVVQCESFADPVALTGDPALALPGLSRAQGSAWRRGDLHVSGFGAYTMRTEYGVLFGRSEAALGFRRYDPFLTAAGEASHALPARLGKAGYRCVFVHPHDLRFYARDRLMPAIGFDRLIGEAAFAPVPPGSGRYVDDRTLGTALGALIDAAEAPTFLYAVTMENHGPWMKDRVTGSPGGLDAWLHHVRSSDAMLGDLIDHLSRTRRPALLVFFGDHRPSIPGAVAPGPARHTPYAMLRFARDGGLVADPAGRADLSPDQLHHAILDAARGSGIGIGGR